MAKHMDKSMQDCYFYFYSTCTKGEHCGFRHEPSALGCETVCPLWLEGKCQAQNCHMRHMELKKNRKTIPCYWETQPIGCRKPHCPFMHKGQREPQQPCEPEKQEWRMSNHGWAGNDLQKTREVEFTYYLREMVVETTTNPNQRRRRWMMAKAKQKVQMRSLPDRPPGDWERYPDRIPAPLDWERYPDRFPMPLDGNRYLDRLPGPLEWERHPNTPLSPVHRARKMKKEEFPGLARPSKAHKDLSRIRSKKTKDLLREAKLAFREARKKLKEVVKKSKPK